MKVPHHVRGGGDSINNIRQMKKLKQFRESGFIVCLPQKPKLDTGMINKLQCQLMCSTNNIIVHVAQAYDYLIRGISIVDDNGDLVTSLDNDLEKKLVVVGSDLNLWYALLQSDIKDEEISIETIPSRYMKF